MRLKWVSVRGVSLLLLVAVLLCFGAYFAWQAGRTSSPPPESMVAREERVQHAEAPANQKKTRPDSAEARRSGEQNNSELSIVLNEPPHVAYRKFLDRAEAGDPRAQLMLSEVLERCRHSSVQSRESLASLEARGVLAPEVHAEYEATLEQCAGLYELLVEYDLDSLWAFWQEEAAGKLAVAKIAVSLTSLEVEYSDELYRQLQAGITAARGDWIQARVIRQAAFAFFRKFVEPTQYDGAIDDAGYFLRSEDSLAWDYLICENSVHCDLEALEQQVSEHFYEYQVSDMRKRAKELDRAIEEGDWPRLGLEQATD